MTSKVAAAQAAIRESSAHKYLRSGQLPSEMKSTGTHRTRVARFAGIWELQSIACPSDLLHRFMLAYSNWESVLICKSDCLGALSTGFHKSLFELNGVPRLHQTDSMSRAARNRSGAIRAVYRERLTTDRYFVIGTHSLGVRMRTSSSRDILP